MRWHIDSVEENRITGWVYDENRPEHVFVVMALKGNSVLGRAKANAPREDLKLAGHASWQCGFSLSTKGSHFAKDTTLVCVNAVPEGDVIIYSQNKESIGTLKQQYQMFTGGDSSVGDSNSSGKLSALTLPKLTGKRFLDIGCNEGFFCQYALSDGATRVVGIDAGEWYIEKAKARIPDYDTLEQAGRLRLLHATWWDLPDEEFDIIIFLSAIHYESRQRELLDFLATRLAPGGMLVLECGVFQRPGHFWLSVARSTDRNRFPTESLLIDTLLSSYAVRYAGPSVNQSGDSVPRHVYHCFPRKGTVVIVRGPSGSGKSVLSRLWGKEGIPVVSADNFFLLYNGSLAKSAPQTPLYRAIRRQLTGYTLGKAGKILMQLNLIDEFCQEFIAHLPLEIPFFCIEGEVFSVPAIFSAFAEALREKGVVAWDAHRATGMPK